MRIIIFVSLAFLISLIKAENWCGVAKQFSCEDDQTCCRGPTGWICHDIKDGKCCDDNLTVCLANQKCDNENHKCI